ncbi:MAG: 4a-hydroxytetrahydrobiopterin dehydratase [Paludibacterium sp.]|uniref:4a-hydroxytetrahydrobiopterin dehydratase n=1 Tax=Paludibacterium sp. TaxID=1917523 RepID=UPI0025DAE330|nr:4a-hydroxytetrahydrobiopterin dehydratase [Paludibacterium sp.]MBV8048278.1 4a-hydroxytetrahydrobiopterin dehydratase [Paludibacterium sp.]MBV8646475.1 4a-hydroxytetrahydrobiopterin dehydratase [Paludibacterium sp.]
MRLADQHCSPDTARQTPDAREMERLLTELPGWQIEDKTLVKTYRFSDYHRTMAFVNALAWIAHQQDHHPDLSVHYNRVRVVWSTHDAGGLTLNDFICAARCQALQADAA